MQSWKALFIAMALGAAGPLLAADPGAAQAVVIPFKLLASRPVVEVTINGKGPFPFVLDTGAGGTTIHTDLVKELNLPVVGSTQIGDPANPHAVEAKQVRIDLLTIGGAEFPKALAVSLDALAPASLGGARGVLGMPLFADRLLTLDYPKSQIVLSSGSLPAADGRQVLTYRRSHGGTFQIPIRVGATSLDADLDSGSPGGLLLPARYVAELPLEARPEVIGHARTLTGEFDITAATLKGFLEIGPYRQENPSVRFTTFLPVGNVGYEILRRFALTIDQQNSRIRFEEVAAGATPEPALHATR